MNMKSKMTFRKILFITAIILVIGLVIGAGCINNQENVSKIVIGIQNLPEDYAVALGAGYLDTLNGIPVEIVSFDSGRDVTTALASGSINFGQAGSVPSTVALANDVGIEIFWIHQLMGSSEALIVKNDANIKTVNDLIGKKIATTYSSNAHYSLLKLLENSSISEKSLTIIDMEPSEIYAAWIRGDIDAAYTWTPVLTEIQNLNDGTILITSEDMANIGFPTMDIGLVDSDFASKHPDLVEAYVAALDKATNLYLTNPDEAVDYCSQYLSISPAVARTGMDGGIWLNATTQVSKKYMGTSMDKGQLAENLHQISDYLYEIKTQSTHPNTSYFEQKINPGYIEKVLVNE